MYFSVFWFVTCFLYALGNVVLLDRLCLWFFRAFDQFGCQMPTFTFRHVPFSKVCFVFGVAHRFVPKMKRFGLAAAAGRTGVFFRCFVLGRLRLSSAPSINTYHVCGFQGPSPGFLEKKTICRQTVGFWPPHPFPLLGGLCNSKGPCVRCRFTKAMQDAAKSKRSQVMQCKETKRGNAKRCKAKHGVRHLKEASEAKRNKAQARQGEGHTIAQHNTRKQRKVKQARQ